jgi:hypothetical protein
MDVTLGYIAQRFRALKIKFISKRKEEVRG